MNLPTFKNIRNVRIETNNPRKYMCDLDLYYPDGTVELGEIYVADGIDKQGICPQVFEAIEAIEDKSNFVSEAQHKANLLQAMEDRPYTAKRAESYPEIGEQLDMLWHAMNNDLIPKAEPFYSEIKSVKDAYPKPEEE